ncbi:MAG: sugar ABC transporter substrate-binding protein [Ignavibacteriaceae bacterium]|nr:sugar ABC transporter substrate-binding protein [Ignavibacteriaceae bacterium]
MKIFFSLVILLLFTGCNQNKEDKTVINFWAIGAEGEKVKLLIPEFEKLNPGIKVRVQQIPWTAAHEKLLTAYVGETLPDVFQIGNTWIPEFASLKTIEPLNNFIDNSNVIDSTNYFAGIWETNIIDSVVYGIPWYVDTRVLFYRKDILENAGYKEPPKTWEELYDLSKKIKALNPTNYSIFLPVNEWLPFILFGMQNGSSLLKNDNTYGNFSGKEFVEAIEYLNNFYREKLAPSDMQQVQNIYQAFEEGYFSMLITGPWNVTEMTNRLSSKMTGKWATAPLPSPNDSYPGFSLAGGASLVVNINSDKKESAWKLIEFLNQKETQITFYRLVSSLPSLKDTWEYEELKSNPHMKAFYAQLLNTKPTPKIPEWEQIVFAKIQNYAEVIASGKSGVKEASINLDSDVNKILEKRRWMLSR